VPKGIPHSWIDTSTDQARLITFTAAVGNEEFFLTLGAPGVGPAGPRAPLPVAEINARLTLCRILCSRHRTRLRQRP
jgi:hypothetical protein